MTKTLLARFDDETHAQAVLAGLEDAPNTESRLCDGHGDDVPLEFTRAREGASKGAMLLAPVAAVAGLLVAQVAGDGAQSWSWVAAAAAFGTLLGGLLGAIAGASDPISDTLARGVWLAVRTRGRAAQDDVSARLDRGGALEVIRR
jgi:hypothetical protein